MIIVVPSTFPSLNIAPDEDAGGESFLLVVFLDGFRFSLHTFDSSQAMSGEEIRIIKFQFDRLAAQDVVVLYIYQTHKN